MERLPHILDKHEETSWQKASASLDASAKIYGFRVDSVHSETFKFLGGLNRADNLSSINEENEDNPEIERKNKKNKNLPNSYVYIKVFIIIACLTSENYVFKFSLFIK